MRKSDFQILLKELFAHSRYGEFGTFRQPSNLATLFFSYSNNFNNIGEPLPLQPDAGDVQAPDEIILAGGCRAQIDRLRTRNMLRLSISYPYKH